MKLLFVPLFLGCLRVSLCTLNETIGPEPISWEIHNNNLTVIGNLARNTDFNMLKTELENSQGIPNLTIEYLPLDSPTLLDFFAYVSNKTLTVSSLTFQVCIFPDKIEETSNECRWKDLFLILSKSSSLSIIECSINAGSLIKILSLLSKAKVIKIHLAEVQYNGQKLSFSEKLVGILCNFTELTELCIENFPFNLEEANEILSILPNFKKLAVLSMDGCQFPPEFSLNISNCVSLKEFTLPKLSHKPMNDVSQLIDDKKFPKALKMLNLSKNEYWGNLGTELSQQISNSNLIINSELRSYCPMYRTLNFDWLLHATSHNILIPNFLLVDYLLQLKDQKRGKNFDHVTRLRLVFEITEKKLNLIHQIIEIFPKLQELELRIISKDESNYFVLENDSSFFLDKKVSQSLQSSIKTLRIPAHPTLISWAFNNFHAITSLVLYFKDSLECSFDRIGFQKEINLPYLKNISFFGVNFDYPFVLELFKTLVSLKSIRNVKIQAHWHCSEKKLNESLNYLQSSIETLKFDHCPYIYIKSFFDKLGSKLPNLVELEVSNMYFKILKPINLRKIIFIKTYQYSDNLYPYLKVLKEFPYLLLCQYEVNGTGKILETLRNLSEKNK